MKKIEALVVEAGSDYLNRFVITLVTSKQILDNQPSGML